MRAPAVVLLLLAAALLLPAAHADAVEQPALALGDEWTYAVTVTDEGGAVVGQGERHVVVTARGAYSFQGGTRDAATLEAWENVTGSGGATQRHTAEVRDAATASLLAVRLQDGTELKATAPCVDVAYPMELGDAWNYDCTLGGARTQRHYSVVGGETLTLEPYGDVDALTVDWYGDDGASRLYYASEACGRQVAERDQVNERVTFVNLTSSRCSLADVSTPPPKATTTPPTSTATTPPTGGATTTTTTTPATPTTTAAPPLAYPKLAFGDAWEFRGNATMSDGRTYRTRTAMDTLNASEKEDARGGKHVTNAIFEFVGYYDNEHYIAATGAYKVITNARVGDGAVVTEEHEDYNNTPPFPTAYALYREYDAPCAYVKWPVTPGTTWDISCSGVWRNLSASMRPRVPFTVEGEGRALAARTIQTRAGEFLAYPVEISFAFDGGTPTPRTIYYAAKTCGPAQLSLDGRLSTALQTLHEYRCGGEGNMPIPTPSESPAPSLALALAALAGLALLRRKRS